MGVFSWPTRYTPDVVEQWEFSNYNQSEEIAWHSAEALKNTFTNIRSRFTGGKLGVFAHSMGNVVTSEALYLAGTRSTPLVDTYVASQAALSTHFYNGDAAATQSPGPNTSIYIGTVDANGRTIYKDFEDVGGVAPRFSGLKSSGAVARMFNYYNTVDIGPASAWEYNNEGRSKRGMFNQAKGFGGVNYYRTPDITKITIYYPPNILTKNSVTGPPILTEATDRYEVYSHLLASMTDSLGAFDMGTAAWGPFDGGFNLNAQDGSLKFGNGPSGHSKQFLGSNQQSLDYWSRLVADLTEKESS
jgi:hypothetical protein